MLLLPAGTAACGSGGGNIWDFGRGEGVHWLWRNPGPAAKGVDCACCRRVAGEEKVQGT